MKWHHGASLLVLTSIAATFVGCGEEQVREDVVVPEAVEAASIEDAARFGEGLTAGGSWQVRWRSGPEGILPLEPFTLEVEIRDADGRSPGEAVVVTADAAMPHHGHGMNFVPRTTALGEGRYRIEGMLFHMRGRWELFVDVEHDGLLERAQWTLEAE
ncbi:MAG: hypothetical protein RJA16_1739 [Planctomycetota bacterium]|jgi:hypothetical protein